MGSVIVGLLYYFDLLPSWAIGIFEANSVML